MKEKKPIFIFRTVDEFGLELISFFESEYSNGCLSWIKVKNFEDVKNELKQLEKYTMDVLDSDDLDRFNGQFIYQAESEKFI